MQFLRFKECIGDCAVVMDCDLQEDPKYISDLLKSLKME